MISSLFLRRIIFIAVCIFALTLPFDFNLANIGLNLPLIHGFSVLEIILMLVVWELLVIFERRIVIKTEGLLLPTSLFFIIHLFSAVFLSTKMIWSLKYTFRFFGLGLIFFIMINFITDKERLNRIVNFLFIGAALAALFVLLQYHFPYFFIKAQDFFDDTIVSPHRIRGFFGWPTDMSIYLGSFIPLVISCLIYGPNKSKFFKKLFYGFLLLIIIWALMLSCARGWILGLFCGLAAIWFLHLLNKREYSLVWISLILWIILVSVFMGMGIDKFMISDLESSETFRMKLVQSALNLIRENPLKGIGADMFYWTSRPHFRTHNILLEATVNLGIFGLLILLWLLWSIFKAVGKGVLGDSGFKHSYLQVGVIGSLVSFLGHSQVDYFWNLHEIIGLFWILIGIGVCSRLSLE